MIRISIIRLFSFLSIFLLTSKIILICTLFFFFKNLPSLDSLIDYKPKIPLRIYTADHILIGEFGEERRYIIPFTEIPDVIKKAIIAIEDDRFYQHNGIDLQGVIRASITNLIHGSSMQGASTITMQVARNFFLSKKKTYTRKIYEMILAYKIESMLTKDQILEIYMNQIYLGQHAYGFVSAAQIYFGKSIKDITLAQAAMLAGLPKAPSAYNPITNIKRAKARQRYILKRMFELNYISRLTYKKALSENIHVRQLNPEYKVHAEYVAEMLRQFMFTQYKKEAYTRGFTLVTTIQSSDQENAYHAVRNGILNYENRHKYRGPETYIHLPSRKKEREHKIEQILLNYPDSGNIISAVVLYVKPNKIIASRINGNKIIVNKNGLYWAYENLNLKKDNNDRHIIRRGAVIRLTQHLTKKYWQITQLPKVEGALIALTPQNGAIRALIGGFDFNQNKFNHVTQAWRQPGSSFKPIIYSASLEKGLGPATIINDLPLFFNINQTGSKLWIPKNYGGHFDGPISMRTALIQSKNLVTIRIMQYIGIRETQKYATRFGFDLNKIPPYLPTALGACLVTPMQMAEAYAVFANGGYRIKPYLISEVRDGDGTLISQAHPIIVGHNAQLVINSGNAYITSDMLNSVILHNTSLISNILGRDDLAGKTGTTNNSLDAWFAGYQHSLVAITWMGYDQPHSLGGRETGGGISLPIWADFMHNALKNIPTYKISMPDNVKLIDGELYLSDKTPGNGFVSYIDDMELDNKQTIQEISTIEDHKKQ